MSESQDQEGDFPGHLLHQASLWDNRELLLDLLRGELRSEIESQDSWGRTALHAASTTQDSQCLQVLLQNGANPNAVSGGQDNFKTPLHTSAEHGFLSNVKQLVAAGADVLSLEGRALTAADLAQRGGHTDTYNFLVAISRDKEEAREGLHSSLREAVTVGSAATLASILRPLSAADRKELLNKTPHGTNSLLFKACESGNTEMVDILLDSGADGRIHPVTKYSPLYIACYHGHLAIVNKILARFPALAKTQTVEKWLPIHAACINGHVHILDVLLHFNYPTDLLTTFRLPGSEDVEYEMAFDINFKDVSDQSSLYIACQLGNPRLVDSLLRFRVPKKGAAPAEVTSPTKGRVSSGIQGIIARLSSLSAISQPRNDFVSPVDVNIYSEGYQTPLHVAVKARNYGIAASLLAAKADPNIPILAPTSTHVITTPHDSNSEGRHGESSALAEACKNRDLGMIELLLKHGARDEDSKALSVASHDDIILGKLLALKAYADPEGTLDSTQLQQKLRDGSAKKVLTTALIPTTPVNVNWHAQRLSKVSENWLVSAGLKLNPKLRLAPGRGESMGLQAITRLDLSNNSLECIPSPIFLLSSLIYLNLSGNKITNIRIPSAAAASSALPNLQEFLLQENRIEKCPPQLFTEFPSLTSLNLSNNKLDSLPASMWLAPKLQDLNASLNLITELPTGSQVAGTTNVRKDSSMTPVHVEKLRRTSSRKSTDSLSHEALWRRRGSGIVGEELQEEKKTEGSGSSIVSLNISHNSFTKVPRALACLATRLQRLNLAFNSLKEMDSIGFYPQTLRQLDLNHNKICFWFSSEESLEPCCGGDGDACPHRTRFRRLDNLKTLLLGGNLLTGLEVSFEDTQAPEGRKGWFPNLTMLDLSENKLTELGSRVASLTQLSVLNLSGNKDLSELPPQLGLLSRIWNLNFQGCNLQEPLKSLVERKGSKTTDIVGYLKSVLEDAKPYARMKLMTVGVHGIGKTTLLSLLRQEGAGKGSDTWAKRMGNSSSKGTGKSGKPISTVGVDIGCLVLDKGNKGPVTFRTWDFGGQREYYATHSYFLSKRSLYLVLWNICDGERGLNEVHGWLVNIQARAPNSPVLIVGTHYDFVSEKFPPGYLDYLEQKIRDKFIYISDPEKRGLPRVLASLEISCRSRYNIKHLSTVIYDAAVSLKTSNGKILLEQRVPSKYIYLEEIVGHLAADRKSRGLDPVLTEDEFKSQAAASLETSYGLKFRDDGEIVQACSFLHENGILLHYEDSTLRDLYFLDPQWLCDMLANVVTIREINPFAQGGSMRVQDLAFLFKGRSQATQDYILVLLSKFELAIPYDGIHLLIPSLLPTLDQMKMGQNEVKVKVALRSRSWMLRNRASRQSRTFEQLEMQHQPPQPDESGEEPEPMHWRTERKEMMPLTRFLLLSYFPSGFWPRLMSRILSDDRTIEILRHYFNLPPASELTEAIVGVVDRPAEWFCWQTGMELHYGDLTLIRIKEVTGEKPYTFMLRRDDDGELVDSIHENVISRAPPEESVWDVVDLSEAGLLEIHLPALSLVLDAATPTVLTPALESVSKLLTLGVEAVDNLLEDWYPSIGTRFVHTSEGKYLVTRLCPCPSCFPPLEETDSVSPRQAPSKSPRMSSDSGMGQSPVNTVVTDSDSDAGPGILRLRTGLAFETPKFGGHGASVGLNFFLRSDSRSLSSMSRNYYAWTVEHCILESQTSHIKSSSVKCPKHGDVLLSHVAPDVLFFDLPPRYLLNQEDIKRKQLLGHALCLSCGLGRGAFGFVFGGILKSTLDVAIKTFHPIDPGDDNEEAQTAYKAAKTKWCRAPSQSACRAYLASRGEIRVLYWVSHPNIIPLLGLVQSPLSIIMPRAPRGALDTVLADFSRSGDRVAPHTVQQSIIQIAKALDYLHGHKIVYRDLKAENILVWSYPPPFAPANDLKTVDLKLADYGISRCSLPTGNKGFGGTEGFMAPEIIRFNGEEEYTEKVDTFSLGMVIYQILSLKQPFDGCENIKESILEGLRPSLRQPEIYPTYVLDLMIVCWATLPKDRPTAAQVLDIASSSEFTLLRDVVSVGTPDSWELNVVTSVGLSGNEVWASCSTGTVYSLQVENESFSSCEAFAFIPGAITAMTLIRNQVWMGDVTSKIHIFQLEGERTSREVELEPLVGQNLGACISIQEVGDLAAVAFSSGRLFLLHGFSGSLVTELGQATILHALAARTWTDSESSELWTGEKGGEMRIFSLESGRVVGQESVCHLQTYQGDTSLEPLQVLLINTHPKKDVLFSYVYPGSTIYSWDGDKREMISRLDVSRFLPSSRETTLETLLAKPLQITVLHSTNSLVFVGTNTGFIFLLGVDGLRHISTFHPFSKDVRSFWVSEEPVSTDRAEEESPEMEAIRPSSAAPARLVVFGKNYFHLFDVKVEEQEQRRAYALLYNL